MNSMSVSVPAGIHGPDFELWCPCAREMFTVEEIGSLFSQGIVEMLLLPALEGAVIRGDHLRRRSAATSAPLPPVTLPLV